MTKRAAKAPTGMDQEAFDKRVQQLKATMPERSALKIARREFLMQDHAGLRGEAKRRAEDGESLREQQAREKEKRMAEEAAQAEAEAKPRGRGVNPDSDRQKALRAAVEVMKRAKNPLSRKDIEERVLASGFEPQTKQKIAGIVNSAQVAETEIDGYKITRPERGKYAAEKV